MTITHRVCTLCREVLPLESFPGERGYALGTRGQCRACRNAIARAAYRMNPSRYYKPRRSTAEPVLVSLFPASPFADPVPHGACLGRGCEACEGYGAALCQHRGCPYVATEVDGYGAPICAHHHDAQAQAA